MITLNLSSETPTGPLNILCLGCHSDDIEIGCGGTILRLAHEHPEWIFHWVVFSAIGERAVEARNSALQFVETSQLRPTYFTFRDGFMPYEGVAIKQAFEAIKQNVTPDLILTHSRSDVHQDHRMIAEMTWNTWRNHFILEYEIPKYDGDMGQPNVFVPLALEDCAKKVRLIMEGFPSQHAKRWFQQDTFMALLRLRGMECNAPSDFAEAFYARKMVL